MYSSVERERERVVCVISNDMALICRVTRFLHNTSFTGEDDEGEEGGGAIQYSSLRRGKRDEGGIIGGYISQQNTPRTWGPGQTGEILARTPLIVQEAG